jgi:hypothetical protein
MPRPAPLIPQPDFEVPMADGVAVPDVDEHRVGLPAHFGAGSDVVSPAETRDLEWQ